MLGLLFYALQASAQVPQTRADSLAARINKRVNERNAARQEAREKKAEQAARVPTAAEMANAFADSSARRILNLARKARVTQDSALRSYDAKTYQRISAGLGFSKLGRDRLVFRTERVDRVRWERDAGLWLEVKGARTVLPGIPEIGEREAGKGIAEAGEMAAVPYFPGYDPIWIGPMTVEEAVKNDGPIHPMSENAEAFYTYKTGDPVTIKLADGRSITLNELQVRPREPKWNLMVGSLWFDAASGQLVRAAYRFAVPMEIDKFVLDDDPTAFDDVPAWVKPMMFPMRGTVNAVTIEYGLYGGRFWMPRQRSAEATGIASFMRVPMKFEQSFTYESVNGDEKMPALPPMPASGNPPDSLKGPARQDYIDSVRAARVTARAAYRDSVKQGLRRPRPVQQCDTSAYHITISRGYADSRIPVATRTPCDVESLKNSPDLPASIYDPGEELFDLKARDKLIEQALAMGVQPPITLRPSKLPPPVLSYGLQMTRYNRVEGLSIGGGISQVIGGGYTIDGRGQFGVSDRIPNLELGVTRSNLTRSVTIGAFTHLVAANDWGNPLNFGSSASALLFGKDEGFYYRSAGVQLLGQTEVGTHVEWRFFVEHHRTADVKTNFSLFGSNAIPNIVSSERTYPGLSLRAKPQFGLDPRGFRLFTDLRLEAAGGDSLYCRGALDLTLTKDIGHLSTALVASGGSSVGSLPTERNWFLGDSHTIRGQTPSPLQSGNAFWRGRAEVGTLIQGARPVLFTDIGWVGDRSNMQNVGRPMSGVGAGASLLDGLLRFDVSRGLYPLKQWRVDFYLDAIF